MAFREAIEGEGGDGVGDLVGGSAVDALAGHAGAELLLDRGHAGLAALEAEGPAELLGLRPGKAGRDHGHAPELLLEERHAQRAAEDGLETRVRIRHRLAAA